MNEPTQTATPEQPPKKPDIDPVRRWTFILLAVAALLVGWYLRSDRVTPYTTQARVNALVVPVAAEVSGTITAVMVGNNQLVSNCLLYTSDAADE